MLEPLDPPDPHEAVFTAAPFAWKNIPLHPLAIAREGDWLMHCRRIGLPPLSVCLDDAETFSAFAFRLLWFCAHEPEVWLCRWMKGGGLELEKEISQWLEKHIRPGDQVEAVRLALDIFTRAHENMARPCAEEEGEPGKAHGPSSRRSIAASSHGPAQDSSPNGTSATSYPRSEDGPTSTRTAALKGKSTSGRRSSTARRSASVSGSE